MPYGGGASGSGEANHTVTMTAVERAAFKALAPACIAIVVCSDSRLHMVYKPTEKQWVQDNGFLVDNASFPANQADAAIFSSNVTGSGYRYNAAIDCWVLTYNSILASIRIKASSKNGTGSAQDWADSDGTSISSLDSAGNYFAMGGIATGTGERQACAQFEAKSTTKGGLMPRMDRAQMLAIANPVVGLEVYQLNDSAGKYIYNGSKWDKVSNLAYLYAENVTSGNPSVDSMMTYTANIQSNNISSINGMGSYTLYPGVYECEAVQGITDNGAGMSIRFYNITAGAYFGSAGAACDVTGAEGVSSPARAILICTANTSVCVKCSSDGTTATSLLNNWMLIKQIS